MNNLLFIADTIYDLKLDYGIPAILRRKVMNVVIETGAKTQVNNDTPINNAIALPKEKRHSFLRSLGNDKAGYLQPEQEEFIIDKLDLIVPVLPYNSIIVNGKELNITKFEDYFHAYYILANG